MGNQFPKSQWEKASRDLSYPRGNHIAMVKIDEKTKKQTMYLHGGNGEIDDEIEEYDENGIFKSKISVSGLTSGTLGHSCVYENNIAYIFGGEDGEYFNKLYKFDMNASRMEQLYPTGQAPHPRAYHCAALYKGKMYIFGGEYRDGDDEESRRYFNDMWEYDIATNTWNEIRYGEKSQTPSPRYGMSAVVYSGKIFIFGGTNDNQIFGDVYKFNIGSKTWEPVETKNCPSARYGHACVIYKNMMLIFGGRTTDTRNHLNDLHVLNLKLKQWQRIEDGEVVPRGRFLASAVVLDNKKDKTAGVKMIVTGGILCDEDDEIGSDVYILKL